MPSFDIVSEIDLQEVDNAVNNAKKEIESRYDLRGGKCEIQWDRKELTLVADDDYKIRAVKDIFQSKLHKRGVEMSAVKFSDPIPAGGMLLKQKGEILQGIGRDTAKDIIKAIKDSKLKVQAQIMEDQIRVTSKSIDSLQEAISFCRGQSFGVPLQYTNMRS